MNQKVHATTFASRRCGLLEATRLTGGLKTLCQDVAFREDASRIRKNNSGEATSRPNSELSTKLGVANKRLKAAWDNLDYYFSNSAEKSGAFPLSFATRLRAHW